MKNTHSTASSSIKPSRVKVSLFWKILAWLWLCLALIITANLFFVFYFGNKIQVEVLPSHEEREFTIIAKKVEGFLRNKPSQRRVRNHSKNVFLIDSNGKDYFEKPVPNLLIELNQAVNTQQKMAMGWRGKEAYWGGVPFNIKDKQFRLYSRQRPPRLSQHMLKRFFKDFARSLLISIFVVSFPLSFFLSWLITSPIRKLQQAIGQLSVNINNRQSLHMLQSRRDEFGELAYDFDDLAKHLAHSMESQQQLINDISHELRSPLTRLKIALAMIKDQKENTLEINADRLTLEVDKMNDLLERLLMVSKLDSRKNFQHFENFDLNELFSAIIESCRLEAEEASISIESQFDAPCSFFGDKELMFSGIENILRNAIKYSPKNTKIDCRLEKSVDSITLIIDDNGPGIESAELDKIFDPFYRPNFDRARASGGVGLGLSIAKRAFELHKGSLKAENRKPNGLRMRADFKT